MNVKINKIGLYLFLLIIFVFGISCNGPKKEYQKYVNDLSISFEDTLRYDAENIMINNMELIITGNIRGKGILQIDNGSGRFNEIVIENKISEIYKTEWYNNECIS